MKVYVPNAPNHNARQNISWKDMRVTRHAMLRAEKRLNLTSPREVQRLAARAKKEGLCLDGLNLDNCEKFQLTPEMWGKIRHYLLLYTMKKRQESRIYLYQGLFFVFRGNHYRTLISIIELGENTSEEDYYGTTEGK